MWAAALQESSSPLLPDTKAIDVDLTELDTRIAALESQVATSETSASGSPDAKHRLLDEYRRKVEWSAWGEWGW
mgnify:CR=1 FL=1